MIKLISDYTHGQLDADNGKIKLDDTLQTSIFFSLAGGNIGGVTTNDRKPSGVENLDWFGNLYLKEFDKPLFNSKFEQFLKKNPLSSGNLITLNQHALSDLQWIVNTKAVKSFSVSFEIVAANKLIVDITATEPDNTENRYRYLWSK